MTTRIALVGCGFLGSIFLEEFLRRAMAGPLATEFLFIDPDAVEKRNVANQQFFLDEIGAPKALACRQRCRWMETPAESKELRLTGDNSIVMLEWNPTVVVSAVDNLVARQLLWELAMLHDLPTLHVGISMQGEGRVEWTAKDGDTFHLSPVQLAGKAPPKDPVSGERPPCELVAMRAAGLMTGLAAARALAVYLGSDAEEAFGKHTAGLMTTWLTSAQGMREIPEMRLGAPDAERLALTAVVAEALTPTGASHD